MVAVEPISFSIPDVPTLSISLPHISLPSDGIVARATPSEGWGTYGYGGSCPRGWNAQVENFCTVPAVLQCCDKVIAGVAGEPDATGVGCMLFKQLLF